jgi:hypothetical protein
VGHQPVRGWNEALQRVEGAPVVKTHVSRTLKKLQLRDRAQLVMLAYESGLVVPGDGHTSAAGRTVDE